MIGKAPIPELARPEDSLNFTIKSTLIRVFASIALICISTAYALGLTVSGTISTNTDWGPSSSPVIVNGSLTVNNGATLTIEPGVVVKLRFVVMQFQNAFLNAQGTAANPIHFTSINDNSVGGATGSGSPAPGDWIFMQLSASSATLANVRMRYGGNSGFILVGAMLSEVNGSTISLAGGDFSFSQSDAIAGDGTSVLSISSVNFRGNGQWAVSTAGLLPALTGCAFASSVNGVEITVPQSVQFNGNTFQSMSTLAMRIHPGVQLLNAQDDMVVPVASGPMHVELSGRSVNNPVTWVLADRMPYVVPNVTFLPGAPLTIPPGGMVKVKIINLGNLTIQGGLTAVGTPSRPITITSIRDDTVGGDTNGDGSATVPAPGDWISVQISGSSATFSNVVMRYGGSQFFSPQSMLSAVNGSTISLAGGDFSFSQSDAIAGDGTSVLSISSVSFRGNGQWAVSTAGLLPALTGCAFASSVNGVQITVPQSVQFNGNTFQSMSSVAMQIDAGLQLIGTQDDVVVPVASGPMHVELSGRSVNNPVTWVLADRMPYVVPNLTFLPGAPLTIPPGGMVKVKMANLGQLTIQGGLTAVGTPSRPITFTSLRDDTVGGDTNGDGSATVPAPGDWISVQILSSSATFSNVIMRYGGNQAFALSMLRVTNNSTAAFSNGQVSLAQAAGIEEDSASVLSVSSVTISSNSIGVSVFGSQADIHQCSIFGNTQFGVQNLTSSPIVQAQFDFWGSTSGPTHPSNPGGTGDAVSNFVNFVPFLTSPVQTLPPQALSVTLLDPNPTQSKTVHFQVAFSNLMNTSVSPLAAFGQTSPFQTFTAFAGTFISSTVWQSSATIPANASDGPYSIRISSAVDVSGNAMLVSTFTFYTVDNTPPFVAITSPTAGATISRPFTATAVAIDTIGVANVVFSVDGVSLFTSTLTPQPLIPTPASFFWDTRNFPDGSHTLAVTAADLAGNMATSSVTVTLNYQSPAPPVITFPANGFATNIATITVSGTADILTVVDILVNNLDVASAAVNAFGQWSTSLILPQQHDISLSAVAFEARGFSVISSSVTGVFTTAKPNPPQSPSAAPIPGGQVFLSWSAPSQGETPAFYRVYRSTNDADLPSGSPAPASDLLANNVRQTQFTDSPAADDLYFYAMTSVDKAGNESVLSDQVFALSDRVPPTAIVSVATVTTPAGPGSYPLMLNLSEVLSIPPILTFTPQGQSPSPLNLSPITATLWRSTLTVTTAMSSGAAMFAFQGIDLAGNIGNFITSGSTLPLDTVGPIGTVTLSKTSPLSVGLLTFNLSLDQPSVSTPTLSFTPQGGSPVPVPLASTGAFNNTSWSGAVAITSTTGEGTAILAYSASDSLGNLGTKLSGGALATSSSTAVLGNLSEGTTFFVIDTIPPGPPLSPRANPGPAGIVVLSWSAPFGERPSSYNLYRDGVRIATGIAPASDGSGTFTDLPTPGVHMYRISSLDLAGNESVLTDPTAVSRITPPSPPINLTSSINGFGQISLTWQAGSTDTASFNLYRATFSIASIAGLSFFRNAVSPFLDSPAVNANYHYAVTALDSVGNESRPSTETVITYSNAPPVITITGITNGGFFNTNVFPAFTAADLTLDTAGVRGFLDGAPLVSGSIVSAEGFHSLNVTASNAGGHIASSTATFTIDKTPPVISFSGVQNGQLARSTVAATISIADLNPGTSTFILFNQLVGTTVVYQSGGLIAQNGAYTLTANAVDLAGNSSTTTLSFQIEIGPPAPINLAVTAQGAGASLMWTQPESDVVAYRVYRDGSRISASLYPNVSFVDSGFAPGIAHVYEVSAVDAQGVEGPRSRATVPALILGLSPITLTRGYFDSIQPTVQNLGAGAISVGPATVQVLDANGVTTGGLASVISVTPGQTGSLSAVVATPVGLAASASVIVTVSVPTDPGAALSFQNTITVQVQDPQSPQVEVFPGTLIPGTLAPVQVRFYNRGSAPMDIITGQVANSTFAPVNNVQVQLLTTQGTLLSAAGIQQTADGANSVLTPAGQQLFFVTIPPGSSFMFDPIRVLIPNTIVNSLNVQAIVSTPTFNLPGIALAGTRRFTSLTAQAVISSVPYTATVFSDKAFYDQGSSVTLSGRTFDLNGFALSSAAVTVHVISNGFERQVNAVTDSTGNYAAQFFPLPNEAGIYNLFAAAPQVVTSSPQSSFTIVGFGFSNTSFQATLAQNSSLKFMVNLQNTGATPITGLTISTTGISGSGITLTLDPSTLLPVLAVGRTATLGLTVSALPSATTSTLSLSVTESHGFFRTLPIIAIVVPSQVFPSVSPSSLLIGVLSGQSVTQSITLTNQGFQTWQGVNLSSPTLPWVQIQGQSFIGDIPPGGNANFSLNIAPPLSVPTTSYAQNPLLTVFSSNASPVPINAGITVTSSQQGNVVFNIINADQPKDASGNGIPVLSATVTLTSNDVPGISFTIPTDANGVARFANVPSGNYAWNVQAPGFQTNSGTTVVQPGIIQTVQVLLLTATISYSWTVTPTSIIDQFNIVLNLTFKTNVLAPALIVNPVDVTLIQSAGQTANTQMTITNVGLVSAFDVNLTESFPPEMQVALPFTNIPEIKAQQSVTVPVKITLIHSSCPNGVVGGNYKYQCAFGTPVRGQMSGTTFRSGGTCTGGTVGGAVIPPGGVEGSVASPPFRGDRPYIGGINGPVQKSACECRPLVGVGISPASARIPAGSSQDFSANLSFSAVPLQAPQCAINSCSWSSSGGVGTISGTGPNATLQASKTPAAGTVSVSCTDQLGNSKSSTPPALVTVFQPTEICDLIGPVTDIFGKIVRCLYDCPQTSPGVPVPRPPNPQGGCDPTTPN